MTVKFAVVFEKVENNWAAYVRDLPGCITTGATVEEAERNIREASEGRIKTLAEFGDPIPRPTSIAKDIDVSPAA
jgi:predicted RNase H-like HicB family nuclease